MYPTAHDIRQAGCIFCGSLPGCFIFCADPRRILDFPYTRDDCLRFSMPGCQKARFLAALGAQLVPKLYPKYPSGAKYEKLSRRWHLFLSKMELTGIKGPFRHCLGRRFGHVRRHTSNRQENECFCHEDSTSAHCMELSFLGIP